MLRRMKSKLRRKLQHGYIHFKGSEEYFIRNGAMLLQESRSTFYGRWNPIHHFSVGDLNNMNVERVPLHKEGSYNLYKGSWEGSVVLVKKNHAPHDKSTMFLREIMVETQLATHNNVHKLLGCCLETKFPVLVYDGMVDVTLHDCLLERDENDQNKQVLVLEWKDRLRIAWEISLVIVYLHTAFHRPIIHRDLKPRNVFLDHDNSAKLSGFGLAISIPGGEQVVETQVAGTLGYVAPEYLRRAEVTLSADVYSFGMLFLGILTGKKVLADRFRTWVRNGLRENNIKKITDPVITRKGTTTIVNSQLIASLKLGRRCVSFNLDDRPTMLEVATQLKNLMAAQEIPDSIPSPQVNMVGLTHKIYSGSKENRERNEALLLEESISLLDGGVNTINYFSVYDLNNMNVEHDLIAWDDDWLYYQGSWEGKAVFVKHPDEVINRMQSRLLREILIATEMAACNSVQKLLGCCLETKFPILVYEWLAPDALNDRILSSNREENKLPLLEWKDRLRIACEISTVVSYLHIWSLKPIIYSFLEPMYVFLDKYDTAKLSSFSRSVLIPEGREFMVSEESEILHVKDHYMPPEYYTRRKVGKCTNVYSFGVLFLALLTGKSVYEGEDDMIKCVKNAIKDNCVIGILDPVIISNGLTIVEDLQLKASIQLAIKCVEEDHGNRPTMGEVTTELCNITKYSESIPIPVLKKEKLT